MHDNEKKKYIFKENHCLTLNETSGIPTVE